MEVEYRQQEEMQIEEALKDFGQEQMSMREKKNLLDSYYSKLKRKMFSL